MRDIEIVTDIPGIEPFRCESRVRLLSADEQSRLKAWRRRAHCASPGGRPPVYFCAHCIDRASGKKLRISMTEREWMCFPRSWKGEQRLHGSDCANVGNGSHSAGVAAGACLELGALLHRAFDGVYAATCEQGQSTPASFCRDLRHMLEIGDSEQSRFTCAHHFCVGVVDNSWEIPASNPDGSDNLLVTVDVESGPVNALWTIAPSVELLVRTTPGGDSLPGLHIVAGAWLAGSSPVHLQAWPVFSGRILHVWHSTWEQQFLAMLERVRLDYIKPPSNAYLKTHAKGEFAEALRHLAENEIWPDVLVKIGRSLCVVEVAGFSGPEYLAGLAIKTMKLLRLEREFGLQWAVLVPVGDQLWINRSSAKLALRDILPCLVPHSSANSP